MTWKFFKKTRLSNRNKFVEPDEIFLDAKNLANFDQQQFEGRIEKPIRKNAVVGLGAFFLLIMLVFAVRLWKLQIVSGAENAKRSENNTLSSDIIFADRGIIYDRNKVELAWNQVRNTLMEGIEEDGPEFPIREYIGPGFSHVLGHLSSPLKDKKGLYWQTDYIGKDGLELQYNDMIRGVNGSKIIELDALGDVQSENTVNAPERGQDLVTSLDSRVQSKFFEVIEKFARDHSFVGGAGIIMDVESGEIIASTSFPEYDNEVLSLGEENEKIQSYLSDKRNVFLDRTISGLYTPGSIVKPFFALAALEEGIIDPYKQILSTGSISIPNPYFPDKPSIFKDWRAHGYTDLSEAIAVSSDVYFYSIGGGYADQKGLGIERIGNYSRIFGFDTKTGIDLPDEKKGVIPGIEWKAKNFKNDPWRLGDTYHTSIGQYGFQVTPIEMARAVAALANEGTLLTPHFILGEEKEERNIPMSLKNLNEVRLGMREAVEHGTAAALNVPYIKVAAKTGTAQVGISKRTVNSWVIGFFPYEDPKYAFTVMMESGPSQGETGASWVMRYLFDWMYWNTPEYFGLPPWPQKKEIIPAPTPVEVTPEDIEVPALDTESTIPPEDNIETE